ncbi:YciI family protein [Streptococcus sp. H31]|uniref:YciI family protein n=1 Tax=Streptococcus huangxiaojuni TaxID=3237239 RepID=UPI0034A126D6
MYLIDITIKTDRVPADRAEELLERHQAWFSAQAESGQFLMVGPYRDKEMAGVVIAQAGSRKALETVLAEDAYYPDMAVYDVHEFQANIIADNITDYKGK